MKSQSLHLFIKQKKLSAEKLLAQLHSLEQEIEALHNQIAANNRHIASIEANPFERSVEYIVAKEHIRSLKQNNLNLLEQIKEKEQQLATLKQQAAQLHAQKKGLEKLLDKLKKAQLQKEFEEENRMADENFLRKIVDRK